MLKRLIAFPASFGLTTLGWWGFELGGGLIAGGLRVVWVTLYYGVFWGGWAAIPLLGLAALLGSPFLPEGGWRGAWWLFGVWGMAWLGVLASLLLVGAPVAFQGL